MIFVLSVFRKVDNLSEEESFYHKKITKVQQSIQGERALLIMWQHVLCKQRLPMWLLPEKSRSKQWLIVDISADFQNMYFAKRVVSV